MGAFYVNISLRGPDQTEVFQYLLDQRRDAIAAPTSNHITVLYDQACDSQDWEVISPLASRLSRRFACPAMAILVHDDDVLWYRLYAAGELVDEYSSNPEYFAPDASGPSSGLDGDAVRLCQTFQCPDQTAEVERILCAPSRGGYALATRRHQDLVQALGLPVWCVSVGFQDLATQATLPHGFLDTFDVPDGDSK